MNLPTLIENRNVDGAVEVLRSYYGARYPVENPAVPKHYTGAWFDEFDPSGTRGGYPNEFTAEDLVSVELLSVRVPGVAVCRLLLDSDFRRRVTELLEQIPVEIHLWEVREPIAASWAPWRLEELLTSVPGLGVTTVSKLIARKRPLVYPVNDTVVRDLVRPAEATKDWSFVGAVYEAFQDAQLREFLAKIRQDAGLPHAVPLLRVFDVLAWMQRKR